MQHKHHDDCGVCTIPVFERNHYFYGKLMTVRDFYQEQAYFNEKRWLMNRMVLGWGVVCGLDVCKEDDKIIVKPGLAIDCCGHELLVCQNWEKPITELTHEYRPDEKMTDPYKREFAICLEYDDCQSEPVYLPPIACDQQERTEYNRIRDSYKIEIKPLDDDAIPKPYDDCCPLMESKGQDNPEAYRLQPYLCNKLKQSCPQCEHGHCLILAKLVIAYQAETPANPYQRNPQPNYPQPNYPQPDWSPLVPEIRDPDPCYKRKLVYNNSLLYSLLHCYHGDLPHIINTNWMELLNAQNNMSFQHFEDLVQGGLTVYFDKPMEHSTINKHSFLITVIAENDDTGYREPRYVPASDISLAEDGLSASFQANADWITDTLGARSRLRRHGGDIEVTLRGSLIQSQSDSEGKPGKALDGDFIGNQFPTGNGIQGGDFVSCFSVLPEEAGAGSYQEILPQENPVPEASL